MKRPNLSGDAPPRSQHLHAAKRSSLVYTSDTQPGIERRRRGTGFRYTFPNGKAVADSRTIQRCRNLVIPPAWTEVWICRHPRGHLQATGKDARQRKQYLYHPDWRATRDATKFDRLAEFGQLLPRIRAATTRDLAIPGQTREKVIALIVRLLEATLIRVGNEEYVRQNRSFGLTTLKNRHVQVRRGAIHFSFRGKSGIVHRISLDDPRLAKLVRRCQELPGQRLFEYLDDDGKVRTVDSRDVNQYLQEISGLDFTAKDFRTWAGTLLAVQALVAMPPVSTEKERKLNITQVVKATSQRLGNTVAICRKCYIHPQVMESYLAGTLQERFKTTANARRSRAWWERSMIRFLKRAVGARRRAA
jgi:DNA topoisomerase-1